MVELVPPAATANNTWIVLAIVTAIFVTVEILSSRVAMYGGINGTSLGIPSQSIDIVTFAVLTRFVSSLIALGAGYVMYAAMRHIKKDNVQEYFENQMQRRNNFWNPKIKKVINLLNCGDSYL